MQLTEFQLQMIFTVNIVTQTPPMQNQFTLVDCPVKAYKTLKSKQDQSLNPTKTRKVLVSN